MPNDATATLRRHVANYLSSTLLPTALPRKVVNSVVAIRLSNSVCFHSFLNRLTFNLFFCMCIVYDHSSPGIENQGRCWLELGLAQSIYPRLRAVFVVNSEAATLNIRVSLLQLVKFLRTWLQTVLSKLSVPFVKQCILFSVPLSSP